MSLLMNQGMSMSKEAEAGTSLQDVVDHLRNGSRRWPLDRDMGLSQEMRTFHDRNLVIKKLGPAPESKTRSLRFSGKMYENVASPLTARIKQCPCVWRVHSEVIAIQARSTIKFEAVPQLF